MKLGYVIEFVSDMNRAVKFYRDVLGFQLKFESPGWSEFVTGETRLALHPASQKKYRRNRGVGFTVPDVQEFHKEMSAKGVQFTMPPTKQDYGGLLARFADSEAGIPASALKGCKLPAANRDSRCGANLHRRRFRHATGVRVFLEQLMLRLQPIVYIVSISTTTLNINFVRE
jgi:catechol 2,3-dioxygenase-like lactoylglutathione lyase family enzyme